MKNSFNGELAKAIFLIVLISKKKGFMRGKGKYVAFTNFIQEVYF